MKDNKFLSFLSNHELQSDPLENEVLYYYWRQYGNNYPILYKCSEVDYEKYKNLYDGTGMLNKNSKNYGGFFLNYENYFSYSNNFVPALTYSANTYYYYYGKTTYGEMLLKLKDPDLTVEMLKKYLGWNLFKNSKIYYLNLGLLINIDFHNFE